MRKITLLLIALIAGNLSNAGNWEFWLDENHQYVGTVAKGSFKNQLIENSDLNSLILFNLNTDGKLDLSVTFYEFGQYEVVCQQDINELIVRLNINGSEQAVLATLSTDQKDLHFAPEVALAIADALRQHHDVSLSVNMNYTQYQVSIDAADFELKFKNWQQDS